MPKNIGAGWTLASRAHRESPYKAVMKSGILKDTDGFDLVVDGVNRTFSDGYDGALQMARNLKGKYGHSRIEIRTRLDGTMREMLEDGRIR
jgi:hypothetical protein